MGVGLLGAGSREGIPRASQTPPHPDQPQVCKELVDLQIKNQRLQEQHDAEIFELKSEVGTDVCPGVAAQGHGGGAGVPRVTVHTLTVSVHTHIPQLSCVCHVPVDAQMDEDLVSRRSCGWRAVCWSWSCRERGQPQQRLIQGAAQPWHRSSGTRLGGRDSPTVADSRSPGVHGGRWGQGAAWVEAKRVQRGTVRPRQLFCAGTVHRLPDPQEQAAGAGGRHRCSATQPEGLSGFLPAWAGGRAEEGTRGLGFHPASHPVPHSCQQRQSGRRSITGLGRRPWRRVCE